MGGNWYVGLWVFSGERGYLKSQVYFYRPESIAELILREFDNKSLEFQCIILLTVNKYMCSRLQTSLRNGGGDLEELVLKNLKTMLYNLTH
jgi:hypothetical protein